MTDAEEAVVEEYAQVAREAVSLMERIEDLSAAQLVHGAATILPRLYLLGFLLPLVDVETENISKPSRSYEEWTKLRESIARVMGEWDGYRKVFDCYEDTEVVMGTLSDDLTDICWDLETPLKRYEGGEIGDAVFEWRETFRSHTGEHTTSAMRAIYWLRRNHV